MSTEDSTQKDIKNRLSKARAAFHKLRPIWKTNQYSRKTKIKLYNQNIKTVLLYGSEFWRVTKADMRSCPASSITAYDKSAKSFGLIPSQM